MLELKSSEMAKWNQTIAVTPTEQGLGMLERAIAKDGAGWGFGLGVLFFLGAIAWFFRELTIKLDPATVAIVITKHIQKTEKLLIEIDEHTESSDGKIDSLLAAMDDLKQLQSKSREMGLEMSGQLAEIERKVDSAIQIQVRNKN